MKVPSIIKASLLFIFSVSAFAGNLSSKYGISEPLGEDVQKRVFSTLFNIELWSSTPPKKYDQPMTIRITFASRFDNGDVIEFLSEEAQEIHEFSSSQLDALRASMGSALTCDPRAKSVLDFNFDPRMGIEVVCDGETGASPIPIGPHSFYLLDVFLHPESEYDNLLSNI